ncbi:MAG: type III-A CRISPR-associated protein Csm2 [Treponema sp.]|jgi:CRISPR-associated protein Csm2|nr:type III-A CRISPR-associated protein Csm2 [Treponema sp.]
MVDNRGQREGDGRPQALPPVAIKSFYADGEKNPKPDLFSDTASKIADTFFIKESKIAVSNTQLRRLFDEVKRFDRLIDAVPEQWAAQLPYIKMIKSKINYAVARAIRTNRSEEGVYKNLADFITRGIDLVKEAKDYHVFVALFEAVYGFYYAKNPKRD